MKLLKYTKDILYQLIVRGDDEEPEPNLELEPEPEPGLEPEPEEDLECPEWAQPCRDGAQCTVRAEQHRMQYWHPLEREPELDRETNISDLGPESETDAEPEQGVCRGCRRTGR